MEVLEVGDVLAIFAECDAPTWPPVIAAFQPVSYLRAKEHYQSHDGWILSSIECIRPRNSTISTTFYGRILRLLEKCLY